MAREQKKITALDIKRATTVAVPSGGSRDVIEGDVLLVPIEVSPEDAVYLVAIKKAVPCDPSLKERRAKAAKDQK